MKVNFYNFQAQNNDTLKKIILQDIEKIIANNNFIEGENNTLLEVEFAKYHSTKYCNLVANGTDAIEIALKLLDLPRGALVAIPGISFFATAEAVLRVGATPIFVDVSRSTGLICPESLLRVISKHDVSAVICVHMFGATCDIDKINSICKKKSIQIIEDSAQAVGAIYPNDKIIGTSGNLITFSFYPTKNLGAFGDAGAILSSKKVDSTRIQELRNHGRNDTSPTKVIGRNSRCDHLQATVLLHKLKYLKHETTIRREIAKYFYDNLKNEKVHFLPSEYIIRSSWHVFPVLLENELEKENFIKFLTEQNIDTKEYYGKALPEELPLKIYNGEVENSIKFSKRMICVPFHPFLSLDEREYVIDTINKF